MVPEAQTSMRHASRLLADALYLAVVLAVVAAGKEDRDDLPNAQRLDLITLRKLLLTGSTTLHVPLQQNGVKDGCGSSGNPC